MHRSDIARHPPQDKNVQHFVPTPISVSEWKPVRTGKLHGTATVVATLTIEIPDVKVLTGRDGKLWVSLPSKPALDHNSGRIKLDAAGKRIYTPFLRLKPPSNTENFSAAVLAGLQAAGVQLPGPNGPPATKPIKPIKGLAVRAGPNGPHKPSRRQAKPPPREPSPALPDDDVSDLWIGTPA